MSPFLVLAGPADVEPTESLHRLGHKPLAERSSPKFPGMGTPFATYSILLALICVYHAKIMLNGGSMKMGFTRSLWWAIERRTRHDLRRQSFSMRDDALPSHAMKFDYLILKSP
jgi:hypothetical protein